MDIQDAINEQNSERVPQVVKVSIYVTPAMLARLDQLVNHQINRDVPTSVSQLVRESLAIGLPKLEERLLKDAA